MFFKQLRRYWEAFNIDVEIEKINEECSQKIQTLNEESKTWVQEPNKASLKIQKNDKENEIYISRLKSLHGLAREIKVAPEIARAVDSFQSSAEAALGNKVEGDKLENRLRYHAIERQSLFMGGVALLVGFGSFFISIVALVVAIVSR